MHATSSLRGRRVAYFLGEGSDQVGCGEDADDGVARTDQDGVEARVAQLPGRDRAPVLGSDGGCGPAELTDQ